MVCADEEDVALHRPNEKEMSDGGRGRASLGVGMWKSSQKWSAQRSAVRSIAWLDLFMVILLIIVGAVQQCEHNHVNPDRDDYERKHDREWPFEGRTAVPLLNDASTK